MLGRPLGEVLGVEVRLKIIICFFVQRSTKYEKLFIIISLGAQGFSGGVKSILGQGPAAGRFGRLKSLCLQRRRRGNLAIYWEIFKTCPRAILGGPFLRPASLGDRPEIKN